MANLFCIQKSITYANTTGVAVGQLPPNAYITDIKVLVTTAFTAGGNDYVDIGDADTAAKFANDVNVASTGAPTVTATAYWGVVQSSSAPTTIYVVYVPAGSTPTAGAAKVVVEYAFSETN